MIDSNPAAGRRKALCVGIDTYADAPLDGCVADAKLWARTLSELKFDVQLLTNDQATRQAILDALTALVGDGRPGDVLVFQFAGHGTQVQDLNGDEEDDRDEALCPVDVGEGALVIDDDIWALLGDLPGSENLTVFLDCCHSGSATRAFGFSPGATPPRPAKRRYMVATRHLQAAHKAFRENLGSPPNALAVEGMRWVNFSACQPHEVAFEQDGHGDFTRFATPIIRSGAGQLTLEEFHLKLIQAFGDRPRQRPYLDCSENARRRVLLTPLA